MSQKSPPSQDIVSRTYKVKNILRASLFTEKKGFDKMKVIAIKYN